MENTYIIRFTSDMHKTNKGGIVHMPNSSRLFVSEETINGDNKFWVDNTFTVELENDNSDELSAIYDGSILGTYDGDGEIINLGETTLNDVDGYEIVVRRLFSEDIWRKKVEADIAFLGVESEVSNINVVRESMSKARSSDHSLRFEEVNRYYWNRLWNIAQLKKVVKHGIITESEYKEISGRDYVA